MSRTPAVSATSALVGDGKLYSDRIEREIADYLTGQLRSENTGASYDDVRKNAGSGIEHRWVGRCKRCGTPRQISGRLVSAHGEGVHDQAVLTGDGKLYAVADSGSNPTAVRVRCGDHWVRLDRVFDDARPGKKRTECGARCLNATGPACDCRCRGANHGSGH